MKTVIDEVMNAVSKLRGDWAFHDDRISLVWECTDNVTGYHVGQIVIGLESYDTDCYRFICNRKEFLATVAECETNFGKCNPINVSHYKLADKVLLTKDLDKELDVEILTDESTNEFKLSSIGNVLHNMSCSMDDEHEQNEFSNHAHFCWDLANYLREPSKSKPQPTPIFTQEMKDNGVLPSVGVKLMGGKVFGGKGIEQWFSSPRYIVCAHHSDGIRFFVDILNPNDKVISDATRVFSISSDQFKPLTPPITLIDGKAYQFDMFNGNIPRKSVSGIYSADDDEFIYLQNVVRTGDCTNIQPLTVEVK